MTMACPLPSRSIVSLKGPDRRAFLQGLISNDIELCKDGNALYAALLTPQGKFLHDMFIVEEDERFLIDVESARAGDFLQRLDAYRLRSRIGLADEGAQFDVWAAWDGGISTDGAGIIYADPRLPALGSRAILPKDMAPAETSLVAFPAYDERRLMLGVPDGSHDMTVGQSTLLECNMDRLNAVSWTKGCYVGQELTARMRYRGLVKKRLMPVAIDGPAPASGTLLMLDGVEVGEMRSASGPYGLALLKTELERPGIAVRGGDVLLK